MEGNWPFRRAADLDKFQQGIMGYRMSPLGTDHAWTSDRQGIGQPELDQLLTYLVAVLMG